MHTPSLRNRVVLSGVAVVAALLVVFDAFVYLTLERRLESTLAEVLEARLDLARELDETLGPYGLASRLQSLGVPAVVTAADGRVLTSADPAVPGAALAPPAPVHLPTPWVSERTVLDDGTRIEVYATRAGVDATLRRVLYLLGIGSALALLAAFLLLRRAADYAMAPLDHIVTAARRTAAGQTGERLDPDDPDTQLGRMAVAYDAMLDSLEDALTEARDAEERTRRFVDDAAHQLRTPLATIRGSVEALLQEPDPRIRDRLLSNLVREAARSNHLLTSLLTMARLDQGRPPELHPTDLGEVCRDELERTQSLAPRLNLVCDVAAEVEGTYLLDGRGTREILANVLDNARRHARSRVELRARRIAPPDREPVLRVEVRDDGAGVATEAKTLIFERFATLDGQGGSGLGLPIARTFARAQGGELSYVGDAFVLELPARTPAADEGGAGGASASAPRATVSGPPPGGTSGAEA
jgi:two-component system, OmpR family, sensor kinase